MKFYELEQEIFNLWHIIEHLKTLKETCENNDRQMNIIIGLIDLYDLKFAKFHEDFEAAMKENHERLSAK